MFSIKAAAAHCGLTIGDIRQLVLLKRFPSPLGGEKFDYREVREWAMRHVFESDREGLQRMLNTRCAPSHRMTCTLGDIAESENLPLTTIERLARQRGFPKKFSRFGGRDKFITGEVLRWLEARRAEGRI